MDHERALELTDELFQRDEIAYLSSPPVKSRSWRHWSLLQGACSMEPGKIFRTSLELHAHEYHSRQLRFLRSAPRSQPVFNFTGTTCRVMHCHSESVYAIALQLLNVRF